MTENEHTRWSEDLATYMLGALSAREAAELERHLEGCERCREEMRWLEPALHALPESVERQEPPKRLRQSADGRGAGGRAGGAPPATLPLARPLAGARAAGCHRFRAGGAGRRRRVGYQVGNDGSSEGESSTSSRGRRAGSRRR